MKKGDDLPVSPLPPIETTDDQNCPGRSKDILSNCNLCYLKTYRYYLHP